MIKQRGYNMHYSELNLKIWQLIHQKGYSAYRLSKESSIPLSTLYSIKNNKGMPSVYTLILLFKFLNISMDELVLGYHVERQIALSPSEEKHIELYRSISPELRFHIDEYIRLLVQNSSIIN